MPKRLVTSQKVARVLKVSSNTILRWRTEGFLSAISVNYVPHYAEDDLDDFLWKHTLRLAQPLKFATLAVGKEELLRPREAAEKSGFSLTQLYRWNELGKVPVIKFPHQQGPVRFIASTLKQTVTNPESDALSLPEAMSIFGIDESTVWRMSNKGQFVRASPPGRAVFVTRASVVRLLEARLPGWIDPEDWIEDHRSGLPLIWVRQAQALDLGYADRNEARRGLHESRAYYVEKPLKAAPAIMLSPYWYGGYIERMPAADEQTLLRLFDLKNAQSFSRWFRHGLVKCTVACHLHTGAYRSLPLPCWLAIIGDTMSPECRMSAYAWHAWRMQTQESLYTLQEVCDRFGIHESMGHRLLAKGTFDGVCTPAGQWRLRMPDTLQRP